MNFLTVNEIARQSCLDTATAGLVAAHQNSERFEIPPREEPDKYIYIFTEEEKRANSPRQYYDECWALWSFWRVPNLSHEGGPFCDRCYYRRKRRQAETTNKINEQ